MSNLDLSTLNKEQLEAVESNSKELLIMAGAGSGKTKTLTSRIARYIETNKAKPNEIMAICFTNKAANELKERVSLSLEIDSSAIMVSTHHSVCFRMLRQVCGRIGFTPGFSIYDYSDCVKVIKELLEEEGLKGDRAVKAKEVLNFISNQKNALVTPQEFAETCDLSERIEEIVCSIYPKYQSKLKSNNAMDFDDALYYTAHTLDYFDDIRSFFFNKYKHIFVDEYQDTNPAQYKIISLLHLPPKSLEGENKKYENTLTVVGDADQSIYAFRGANIRNIEDFEKDFPNATTIYLNTNYRSTQEILDLANVVISENHSKPKNLIADNCFGELPQIFSYKKDYLETANVVDKIKKNINNGVNPNEIAVLYRMNSLSGSIEQKLIEERIPYKIIGGIKFFERREIKDVLAYLTILVNPNDNLSLLRIINYPKRNIGLAIQKQIATFAQNKNLSIWEYITSYDIKVELPTPYKKLFPFITLIKDLKDSVSQNTPIEKIIEDVLDETSFLDTLRTEDEAKDEDRAGNIYQLINFAKRFDNTDEDERLTPNELDLNQTQEFKLSQFLETVTLYSQLEEVDSVETNIPSITLMTLHSSKGLEFDYVYIIGLEDTILPVRMTHENEKEIEEERRLLYVGITRARKSLHCSYSLVRARFGYPSASIPSRFIIDLDPKYFNTSKPSISYYNSTYNTTFSKTNEYLRKNIEDSSSIKKGKKSEERNKDKKQSSFTNLLSLSSLKKVSEQKSIEIGTTVSHNAFGIGKVEGKQVLKKSTILFIKFSSGTKQIIQEFANLEILD